MSIEASNPILTKEVLPEYKYFEGVWIQWNKVRWNFDHQDLGKTSIDTYSIWNPAHHEEIAERLASGERCGLYLMGNFGVAELRVKREKNFHDPIFDDIKQRPKMQTLIVFAHPNDTQDYIDFDKLPAAFEDFQKPEKRLALYPGPMHAIFPIKKGGMVNLGIPREDGAASFFWIPGHFGYEELYKKVKAKIGNGLLAGGSLNIHGQEPSYTTSELRDQEMVKHKQWQENIKFIILDEIAESSSIGRSHTQVSFMEDPPRVVRLGSLSIDKISRETGYKLVFDKDVKRASSKTKDDPYDDTHNLDIDTRVEIALARMARFQETIRRGEISSGPQM